MTERATDDGDEQAQLDALLAQQEGEFIKTQKKAAKKAHPRQSKNQTSLEVPFFLPMAVVPERLQDSIPENHHRESEIDAFVRQTEMLRQQALEKERYNTEKRAAKARTAKFLLEEKQERRRCQATTAGKK